MRYLPNRTVYVAASSLACTLVTCGAVSNGDKSKGNAKASGSLTMSRIVGGR
jgi:hypothetical protein